MIILLTVLLVFALVIVFTLVEAVSIYLSREIDIAETIENCTDNCTKEELINKLIKILKNDNKES